MSQELQLGKYEFYPYEFDKEKAVTLDELLERLEKRKTKRVSPKRSATRRKRRAKE